MIQTVLITGASRGIGLSVAQILLDKGANVITLSRSTTEGITELAKKYPNTLSIVSGDITKEEHQAKAVDTAISKYGSLDGIILNAAQIDPLGSISEIKLDEVRNSFEVNFFSCVKLVQLSLPHLRKSSGGRIVFVSTQAVELGIAGWTAYNTAKASMNALCRTLASEEESLNTIVAISPGVVDTAMQKVIRDSGDKLNEQVHQNFINLHSSEQLIRPEQPGKVLANLALSGDKELNGLYFEWNDAKLSKYQ